MSKKTKSVPVPSQSAGASPASSLPAFVQPRPGGVQLAVRLQPRASRTEIEGPLGDELRIRVSAPPVDAAANEALLRLLADVLGCPRGSVQLVRGHTSRHKTVFIRGLEPRELLLKLGSGEEPPAK